MLPSGSEILVIILVVLVLFGGDKIPEIARFIGKGISELQKAASDFKREIELDAKNENEKKKVEPKG